MHICYLAIDHAEASHTVFLRWSAIDTGVDGPYQNHGVHIVTMRWGKVVAIDANEDSQAVAENLRLLAAHAVEEATAPPIVS